MKLRVIMLITVNIAVVQNRVNLENKQISNATIDFVQLWRSMLKYI